MATATKKPTKKKTNPSKAAIRKTPIEAKLKTVDLQVAAVLPDDRNRVVKADDPKTLALAESIRQHGQQQDILVRTDDGLPTARYRIVFGERRWLACKLAGLDTVSAKIRTDLTASQALVLMAVENDDREALNDIERATMIDRLCKPVDKGGSGMSRADAGKIYKISHSTASNLVRLLKLPASIKKLIVSGEMPQTFAREICSYPEELISSKLFTRSLEDEFKHWTKNKWAFPTRQEFTEDRLPEIVDKITRVVEPRNGYQSYSAKLGKQVGRLFELDDKIRTKLKMFGGQFCEQNDTKKTEQVRTLNIKEFDKLQADAESEQKSKAKAKSAASNTASKSTKKHAAKTDAEIKAAKVAKRKQDEIKFKTLVSSWRSRWIRLWLAGQMNSDAFALRVVLLAVQQDDPLESILAVGKEMGCKLKTRSWRPTDMWKNLTSILPGSAEYSSGFIRKLASRMIWEPGGDNDFGPMFSDVVELAAKELKFDADKVWGLTFDPAATPEPSADLLKIREDFWACHTADQLASVVKKQKLSVSLDDQEKTVAELLKVKTKRPAYVKKV